MGQERGQYFDGYISRQSHISSLVNLAHASCTDELDNFVVFNFCSRLDDLRFKEGLRGTCKRFRNVLFRSAVVTEEGLDLAAHFFTTRAGCLQKRGAVLRR